VRVDDVENFFAKVQQVAAAGAKRSSGTTSSFQSGAIEFAHQEDWTTPILSPVGLQMGTAPFSIYPQHVCNTIE